MTVAATIREVLAAVADPARAPAMRQLARTKADDVRRYVTTDADRLSGLPRRKAIKHIGPATATRSVS